MGWDPTNPAAAPHLGLQEVLRDAVPVLQVAAAQEAIAVHVQAPARIRGSQSVRHADFRWAD